VTSPIAFHVDDDTGEQKTAAEDAKCNADSNDDKYSIWECTDIEHLSHLGRTAVMVIVTVDLLAMPRRIGADQIPDVLRSIAFHCQTISVTNHRRVELQRHVGTSDRSVAEQKSPKCFQCHPTNNLYRQLICQRHVNFVFASNFAVARRNTSGISGRCRRRIANGRQFIAAAGGGDGIFTGVVRGVRWTPGVRLYGLLLLLGRVEIAQREGDSLAGRYADRPGTLDGTDSEVLRRDAGDITRLCGEEVRLGLVT
jgi:hypothetical protein